MEKTFATVRFLGKYGLTGGMGIALFWMNSRLSYVEERLFDCYDRQIYKTEAVPQSFPQLAILTKEPKVKTIDKTESK